MKGIDPVLIIAGKNPNYALKPHYVVISVTRGVVTFETNDRFNAITMCNGLGRQGEVAHVVRITWMLSRMSEMYVIYDGLVKKPLSRSNGQLELSYG